MIPNIFQTFSKPSAWQERGVSGRSQALTADSSVSHSKRSGCYTDDGTGVRLTIIIANHNYRDFLGAAITSALAVDWADKEVIVVDDASTDGSRSVIESFTGRVMAYFRPKSDQLGAHMFGFKQSTGDVVIFLDADDLLEPDVMQEVAKVWRPGISKVQYRMNLIDADGAQLGTAFPQFAPTDDPKRLRRNYLKTMMYAMSPGTGNAYSRQFVRSAFSLAPSTMSPG